MPTHPPSLIGFETVLTAIQNLSENIDNSVILWIIIFFILWTYRRFLMYSESTTRVDVYIYKYVKLGLLYSLVIRGLLENTSPLGGGGISADVIWGKKHEKVKRKRRKM
jgi:hypothetical protein